MFPKRQRLTEQEQEILVYLFIECLIDNNLPFYIAQKQTFHTFINALNPDFNIPCEATIKKYLEIANNFEIKKALLSLEYVAYPHTAEKICELLINIIKIWNLEYKTTSITTDNRSNIICGTSSSIVKGRSNHMRINHRSI